MTPQASRSLRVAVVGAGYVATHHLAALSRLDFVEVVGLCDSNRAAAEALAARFKVGRVVASLAELADAKPNVVYVLTPPASHATLAIQAMDMGCHVLVEKPMADSAADCEAMLAKSKATGLTLGVNHSDLFDPVLMQALSGIGTAAMIWVGGGILVHGFDVLGWHLPESVIHHAAEAVHDMGGFASWLITAIGSGIFGLAIGGAIALALHAVPRKSASH